MRCPYTHSKRQDPPPMPVVKVEPTKDHVVPYDNSPELAPTLIEELAVAGNTAELQYALGAPLEINTQEEADATTRLFEQAISNKKLPDIKTPAMAFAAAQFLREYGSRVAFDVAQTRTAITVKLMEIANCGDPKFELKALELLGKHSDIGLFTERSEITINYKDPAQLEEAIKERVKRLLNADIIDVTPLGMNLDEELGVFSHPEDEDEDTDEDEDEDEDTDEDAPDE